MSAGFKYAVAALDLFPSPMEEGMYPMEHQRCLIMVSVVDHTKPDSGPRVEIASKAETVTKLLAGANNKVVELCGMPW